MDDVRKCSKCKTFTSKSNFHKDISIKDGFNPICKTCRRGNYKENFDQIKNYRKHYDKIRKESDLNFKLACNLRSRTSKAFKSQNKKKKQKKQLFYLDFLIHFSKVGSLINYMVK